MSCTATCFPLLRVVVVAMEPWLQFFLPFWLPVTATVYIGFFLLHKTPSYAQIQNCGPLNLSRSRGAVATRLQPADVPVDCRLNAPVRGQTGDENVLHTANSINATLAYRGNQNPSQSALNAYGSSIRLRKRWFTKRFSRTCKPLGNCVRSSHGIGLLKQVARAG